MKYSISEEQLLQLLEKAYEAGCSGYRDLKDSSIGEIVDDFIKNNPPVIQKELFTTVDLNSSFIGNTSSITYSITT